MDARVEAERETADEGWPGRRRGRGRTGRKGRGKAQGTQVARAQCIAANGVGAKNIHLKNSFRRLHLYLAAICMS